MDIKKELDKYVIPDITNIIASYTSNIDKDYCCVCKKLHPDVRLMNIDKRKTFDKICPLCVYHMLYIKDNNFYKNEDMILRELLRKNINKFVAYRPPTSLPSDLIDFE